MRGLLAIVGLLTPISSAHSTPAIPTPTNFLNTTPIVLEKVSGTTFTDIALRPGLDVWAAGLGTVTRYDGHGVSTYQLPKIGSVGLPVARVAEVFVGPAKRIWAAGFGGGIFKFNPNIGQFQMIDSVGEHPARVVEVKHDGGTGLWYGFSDGSCLVVDIELQTTKERCQGIAHSIVDFAFDSASKFALSEDGTVLRLDAKPDATSETKTYTCSVSNIRFTEIAALNSGTVLLGTQGGGLFKCPTDQGGGSLNPAESVNAVSQRTTIHEIAVAHGTGRIFVATDSGLEVLDAASLDLIYSSKHASDLVSTEFTALTLQGSDTVWAASFAGIYRLHTSATMVRKNLPGNPTPSVVGFASLGNRVVIADYAGLYLTDNGGVADATKNATQHICSISGGITAVTTWKGQIVYGLRSGGVSQLSLDEGQQTCGEAIELSSVGPISTITSASDLLLIGTFGEGAYIFDENTGLQQMEATMRGDLARRRVLHIEEIKGLGFLLLTEGGIVTAPNEQESQAPLNKISKLLQGQVPWAASLFEDLLWLATPTNGVFVISLRDFPSRDPQIIVYHELPGETIQAVEAISGDQAIVSSTTGLFRLSTDGVIEYAFNAAGNSAVRFDFGASLRDESTILFGGTGGYAMISSSGRRTRSVAVHHRVTSYAIDDREFQLYRPLNQSDKVLLNADEQRLTFKLGSLAPWAAHDLEFRYRLEGFDSGWNYNRLSNEISYTNLPPGSYVFQSQASTKEGKWNAAAIALKVDVLPPWWRSSWALLGYAITAIGLFLIAKHYYGTILVSRRATQLAREMTATAEQAIEDMQDEVETQARLLEKVTDRNVATLSWIGEVVGRQADTLPDVLSSEMAKVSLERIEAFVCLEHALRYRDDRVLANLRSFTDDCSAMLLSRRSNGSSITLINEVSEALIDAEHAARLATVIYELLANALDHAFAGRAHGNFLRIAMELTLDSRVEAVTATVTVEDNGIGLPAGVSLEEYETSGFSLVRDVASHYGGRVVPKATDSGTSLRVELPLPEDAVA